MARGTSCPRCGCSAHLTENQIERLLAAAELLPDSALINMVDGFMCGAILSGVSMGYDRAIVALRELKHKVPVVK